MTEITEELIRSKGGIAVIIEELREITRSDAGNAATSIIKIGPYPVGALLHISASGTSRYQGPAGNAGITMRILQDSGLLAMQDSFEGTSSNMEFQTAASCSVFLPANTDAQIRADVNYRGAAGQNNKMTEVDLRIVSVAAIKIS